jgi:hypothetical protein
MITFKIAGKSALGKLDNQTFTVDGEETTTQLLNAIAKAHPVTNGGSPDPDFDLFQNVAKQWPYLTIVSEPQPAPRHSSRIY